MLVSVKERLPAFSAVFEELGAFPMDPNYGVRLHRLRGLLQRLPATQKVQTRSVHSHKDVATFGCIFLAVSYIDTSILHDIEPLLCGYRMKFNSETLAFD